MDVAKISIEKIISKFNILLDEEVILDSISDEKVKNQYIQIINNTTQKMGINEMYEFVTQNSQAIDKEKFVLNVLFYYAKLIKYLKEIQDDPSKKELYKIGVKSEEKLRLYVDRLQKQFNQIKTAFKDFDYTDIKEKYTKQYDDRVVICKDAKLCLGKRNEKYKKDRVNKIKEDLKAVRFEYGNAYNLVWNILSAREATDIYENERFNDVFYNYCLNKYIMKQHNIPAKDIDSIRQDEEFMARVYKEVDTSFEYTGFAQAALNSDIQYADIDKFLMHAALRIQNDIERNKSIYEEGYIDFIKNVLEVLKKHIKTDKKVELNIYNDCELTTKIKYSKSQIDICLKRFVNGGYITNADINEIRNNLYNAEQTLSQVDVDLNIIFPEEELKKFIFSGDENFKFLKNRYSIEEIFNEGLKILKDEDSGVEKKNVIEGFIKLGLLNKDKIYEFYKDKYIMQEEIKHIMSFIGIEEIGDIDRLLGLYEDRNKNQKSEEQYDEYLKFNKLLAESASKNEEGRNQYSESLMEKLAENYDPNLRKEYIEKLENFYQEGLLDLKSIISWEDQNIIVKFLEDKVLNIRALILLKKNGIITDEYFQNLYGESLLSDEVTNEFRMDSFKKGLVSEDYIAKAYIEGLISKSHLNELFNIGKISRENELIKARLHEEFLQKLNETIEVKKDNSNDTKIDFSDVQKPKIHGRSTINQGKKYRGKTTKIIKAAQRENYFKLFGAAHYTDRIKVGLNGAFYNYDFYIIPDENGEIGENSVIIAERYFDNRKTKDEYAVDNRTYFFRCEDFIDTLTKEETNTNKRMFRVNHKLATKNKKGTWAQKVKEAIAKTMLGDDLSDYSEANANQIIEQKLKSFYTEKELAAINSLCEEIDYGLHDELLI